MTSSPGSEGDSHEHTNPGHEHTNPTNPGTIQLMNLQNKVTRRARGRNFQLPSSSLERLLKRHVFKISPKDGYTFFFHESLVLKLL